MKELILTVLLMNCLVSAEAGNDDGKTQDHRLGYSLIGGAVGLVSGGAIGTAAGFAVASGDWWPMQVLAGAILGSAVGLPAGIIIGYQKGKPKQGANPGIKSGLLLMPTVTYKF